MELSEQESIYNHAKRNGYSESAARDISERLMKIRYSMRAEGKFPSWDEIQVRASAQREYEREHLVYSRGRSWR